MPRWFCVILLLLVPLPTPAGDTLAEIETTAVTTGHSSVAHWGKDPAKYTQWGSHSNRLVPVYTFGTRDGGKGIDLRDYTGEHSAYRSADALRRIYGYLPVQTVNPDATYLDQTNIHDIQAAALATGRKHIFLVIFDGMDWQTTRAAAIYHTGSVAYDSGRGRGLHFQDYTAGGNTQFGFMVTSPHNDGTRVNVDEQTVLNPGGNARGGYDPLRGGFTPWTAGPDVAYLLGEPKGSPTSHVYTDSAASATAMTTGVKTYNDAINVDPSGARVPTIAHQAQEAGYAVGAITSVPISHATPACAYAHNVSRDDYQDLARDLLGRPSISHPDRPLPGLDVVIGTGWGANAEKGAKQGANFVPGNPWLTADDLHAIDAAAGGRYVVAQRTAGADGGEQLQRAAEHAAATHHRLLGFYGTSAGHLPFATANGDYSPVVGRKDTAESYTPADLEENPNLAEMTAAALTVLEANPTGSWLMVEAGDVDWANHDDNLDNSIGAVLSGDAAVSVITDWVEQHSNWDESLLIVTADHGHYLFIDDPQSIAEAGSEAR
jgi:alkaline phosphatase